MKNHSITEFVKHFQKGILSIATYFNAGAIVFAFSLFGSIAITF